MGRPKAKGKAGKKGSKPKAAPAAAAEVSHPGKTSVWRPGVDQIESGEALDYDPTAYDCLTAFSIDWPCLSFDVLRDDLGGDRSKFPHTLYLVAGTQAPRAQDNYTALLKLTGLTQEKHGKGTIKKGSDDDMDDESASSDSELEEAEDGKPVLHSRRSAHHGAVNRVRAMPQQPTWVATQAEIGTVMIFDFKQQLEALHPLTASDASSAPAMGPSAPRCLHRQANEGYALDWSPVTQGLLGAGDCSGSISLLEPDSAGRWAPSEPLRGHEGSVEDIHWAPAEACVFASAGCDGTVRVWDTRQRAGAMLTVKAHDTDVNVITWSSMLGHMLASGADDGCLRAWDLRTFAQGKHLGEFRHHKQPITAVEWSPREGSVLCTSSSDGTVGVWDLSVERDAEEEAALGASGNAETPSDLPPQLLFLHAGQSDIKDVHWHPQIPGMLVSTGLEGFNAYKPANVTS